jgi:hypothetical protein
MTAGRLPSVEGGIQPTIVDAKGDLIAATAADTPARIGVGSNGQLLSANSSTATGLEWATISSGGMTAIATTTFNNTVATYTYSSLGSYKHLYIIGQGLSHNDTGTANIDIQFNADTGSNYNRIAFGTGNTSFESSNQNAQASGYLSFRAFADNDDATLNYGTFTSWIPNYRDSVYKSVNSSTMSYVNGSIPRANTSISTWNDTSAITSFTISTGVNFKTGTLTVYGVS